MADGAPARQPFVRPYNAATDADAIFYICQQTAAPSLRHEPAISIAPYIWAVPYTRLHPDFCFVLDPATGSPPVGYIVGTPDTETFVARYTAEYLPGLDRQKLPKPTTMADAKKSGKLSWAKEDLPATLLAILHDPEGADDALHADFPGLLHDFPAHLHIDILRPYQRQGHGRALIETFCAALEGRGTRGVHLVMAGDNVEAEKFYGRVGFGRFGEVLGGEVGEGEVGRAANGTVWLVRRLDGAK